MTIQEAIQQCDPDQWIRPVTWRGTGCAISIEGDGRLGLVPGLRPYMYRPRADEILSSWEIVEPAVVCEERP